MKRPAPICAGARPKPYAPLAPVTNGSASLAFGGTGRPESAIGDAPPAGTSESVAPETAAPDAPSNTTSATPVTTVALVDATAGAFVALKFATLTSDAPGTAAFTSAANATTCATPGVTVPSAMRSAPLASSDAEAPAARPSIVALFACGTMPAGTESTSTTPFAGIPP